MRSMTLYALRLNTHVWASPKMLEFDDALEAAGYTLLDVDWSACQLLKNDRDHFTRRGFRVFCEALAHTLQREGIHRLSIYADSTIDYCNYSRTGAYTHQADRGVKRVLSRRGIELDTIDSWSGSGFVRPKKFSNRVVPTCHPILLIGGWNDASASKRQLSAAARRTADATTL